jgi:2'-5' RNA ligase
VANQDDTCCMCARTAGEIAAELGRVGVALEATLLWRPRSWPAKGGYHICLQCAGEVKRQQDERLERALEQAERSGV